TAILSTHVASLSSAPSCGHRRDLHSFPTRRSSDLSTHDGRERDSHAEMDGVAVPFDEPFMLPDGSRVMHPCDSSLGAAAAEIINCRCTVRHVPLSEVQIDNS